MQLLATALERSKLSVGVINESCHLFLSHPSKGKWQSTRIPPPPFNNPVMVTDLGAPNDFNGRTRIWTRVLEQSYYSILHWFSYPLLNSMNVVTRHL
ncbi:hypothetical protein lerEdw1_000756 [Lerista edwardsae]|nr:hypothetical protein lerEdw1_000757 [Lerista edwardsae]KAJ6651155.1 hypothetical protein lerEdw1_000756 [Lerista edwardsae]